MTELRMSTVTGKVNSHPQTKGGEDRPVKWFIAASVGLFGLIKLNQQHITSKLKSALLLITGPHPPILYSPKAHSSSLPKDTILKRRADPWATASRVDTRKRAAHAIIPRRGHRTFQLAL